MPTHLRIWAGLTLGLAFSPCARAETLFWEERTCEQEVASLAELKAWVAAAYEQLLRLAAELGTTWQELEKLLEARTPLELSRSEAENSAWDAVESGLQTLSQMAAGTEIEEDLLEVLDRTIRDLREVEREKREDTERVRVVKDVFDESWAVSLTGVGSWTVPNHSEGAWAPMARSTPDGEYWVVREGEAIAVHSMKTGKRLGVIHAAPGGIHDISFSPDSKKIASVSAKGAIEVHELPSLELLNHFDTGTKAAAMVFGKGPSGEFDQLVISIGKLAFPAQPSLEQLRADPKRSGFSSFHYDLTKKNPSSRPLLVPGRVTRSSIDGSSWYFASDKALIEAKEGADWKALYSGDYLYGQLAEENQDFYFRTSAEGHNEGWKLRQVVDGKSRLRADTSSDDFFKFSLASNALKMLTAKPSYDGNPVVRVWDLETGRRVSHELLPPAQQAPSGVYLYAVALSPDARFAAFGWSNGTIEIWQVDPWEKFASKRHGISSISDLKWLPCGNELLSQSAASDVSGTLRHWSFDPKRSD